jgi:hypothetical protein
MNRQRLRDRFRIIAVAMVTVMQLPAVTWMCLRARSLWPVALGIAL